MAPLWNEGLDHGGAADTGSKVPLPLHQSGHRDAVVEDEIFHCGYFADVVFRFPCSPGSDVVDVHGQGALFSMLSPVLRDAINKSSCQASAAIGVPAAAGGGRREVWLNDLATGRAFQEVARYVYHLPQRFTVASLPETFVAARRLGLDELERWALDWGLMELTTTKPSAVSAEDSQDVSRSSSTGIVDDALRSLDTLCTLRAELVPRDGVDAALKADETAVGIDGLDGGAAVRWRQALLHAFTPTDLFNSAWFCWMSPAAMQELLQDDAVHVDPGRLWLVSVTWARARAEREGLPTAPDAQPLTHPLWPAGRCPPRGARLAIPPPPPADAAVEWQRCLTPLADLIRFAAMCPADFAKHMEVVDPMLPQLRQVVYASRRRGLRDEKRS